MQLEKEQELNRLINEQEAMRADRREEMRRMTQQFNDQILRLENERKEREIQVEALTERLMSERADSDRRILEAMAKSDDAIIQMTAETDRARSVDRASYEARLTEMREQREAADQEHERWREEVRRSNEQIAQYTIAQQTAGKAEYQRLEEKIAQLEEKKKSGTRKVFKIVGKVLGLSLPLVMGAFGIPSIIGGF
jgi:chromosome segregation ATPase